MRILVDNGSYHMRNLGDVSMLQVAVARLRNLWPDAIIQCITEAPQRLRASCPGVIPLASRSRDPSRLLTGRFHRLVSPSVLQQLLKLEGSVWDSWLSPGKSWVRAKLGRPTEDKARDIGPFLRAIIESDLVIASGGGYVTDLSKWHAIQLLDTLEIATRLAIPTAMLGQGVGPARDPELLSKARAVLPAVDLIALREKRAGPAFLDSLGVAPERVITTGDDSIELAYSARPARLGASIGVNLRVSRYSTVDEHDVEVVRPVIQEAARKYEAPLVPVPVSLYRDVGPRTIRQLLVGYDDSSSGGRELDTPLKLIRQIGRCRVVVVGSYHPAVFALAQGIPCVCVAKCAYYVDKFKGLADLFGAGCAVLLLEGDGQFEKNLMSGIDRAWNSAEKVRPSLLEAAVRQVDLSKAAYRRIYDLVGSWQASE